MHTSEFIEDLNRLKDLLQEESHRKYVEAIISAELMDRLRIEKEKSESLDEIYDDYIDNSTIQLISEELYDLYEKKISFNHVGSVHVPCTDAGTCCKHNRNRQPGADR